MRATASHELRKLPSQSLQKHEKSTISVSGGSSYFSGLWATYTHHGNNESDTLKN